MDKPQIIKSAYDGVRFCFWLEEHPEITNIQGWHIERMENGIPARFGNHLADAEFIWRERKIFNDWIRTNYH